MDVKMEDVAAVPLPAATAEEEDNAVPLAAQKIEKSPYDVLKESKRSVEGIIAKMLSIKKEDMQKSELRELITQMFLHFVSLLQANRTILVEEDRVKSETERAKAPVDSTALQLHNLIYEKRHYLKAIKGCKDFKSKYPDIQHVSEEEFFSKAPEEFIGTVIPNDSAHNVMLKRLNYELFQRKELCKLREKLEQQKKSLSETIANRKKFLSSLPSHLKALKKASLPAQNQLGVLPTKLKQLHAAELLPSPLYIIYSQFMAQKEAFDEHIEIEIIGSFKDAQVFARRQTCKDTAISTNHESSKIEDDAPNEEDDGQQRSKRPKKVAGKENLESAGVFQAHPLRVILHVLDDEASNTKPARLVTLKFEYLFKLNVVCVGIEGSDEETENNIMCNLFPDDEGLELPHQPAKLSLGDDGAVFDERHNMRPYKWVQHLAGIDFLPEVAPLLANSEAARTDSAKDAVISDLSLYRQQNQVQTIVQRVRSRKKAQLALVEQLDLLTNLKWPLPTCENQNVPLSFIKHQCCLHSWNPVGSSCNQPSSFPGADMGQAITSMDVNMVAKSGTSREELGNLTEDGKLPSLILVAAVIGDGKSTPILKQGSGFDDTKRMELMFDIESEVDDYSEDEREMECKTAEVNPWVDYATRCFNLAFTRKNK